MKKSKHRTFVRAAAFSLSLAMLMTLVPAKNADASSNSSDTKKHYAGDNLGAHDYYGNTFHTVKSYLEPTDNGFMLLKYVSKDNYGHPAAIVVENYDNDFNFISTEEIPEELPKFGGFYASDDRYFIITGDNNPNEDDNKECYRITAYDKDWNRIASDGLTECNTYEPFRAGTVSCTSTGNILAVRTCHTMYADENNLHHQANVTILYDMTTNKITDSFTEVWNISGGYVSHSFNQDVAVDGNSLISLDHGDAYPRSIVMCKYDDISGGTLYNPSNFLDVIPIDGNIGDNYTATKLGGVAVAKDRYVTCGTTYKSSSDSENQAVYFTSCDKNLGDLKKVWLSDFYDNSKSGFYERYPSKPYIISLDDGNFIVMWTDGAFSTKYVKLDEYGNKLSDVKSYQDELSDCKPVQKGNKLYWFYYVSEYNSGKQVFTLDDTCFFTLDLDSMEISMKQDHGGIAVVPAGYSEIEDGAFTNPNDTTGASYAWITRNSDSAKVVMKNGEVDKNEFISDGTFTYYVQNDGTVMKDRLTYHPDGQHVIYFDAEGHEVFNAFTHPSSSVEGKAIPDGEQYYFNVYGYMYVNTVTYDVTGTKLYYINPYGQLEHNGWFLFDADANYGDDGSKWAFTGSHLGFANYDGTLLHDAATFDYNGTPCYMQGNGEAAY